MIHSNNHNQITFFFLLITAMPIHLTYKFKSITLNFLKNKKIKEIIQDTKGGMVSLKGLTRK